MSTQHLSEQEIIRREKLEGLRKLGIDPYPAPLYPVNTNAVYIKANYKGEENKADFADVCLAGRIMSVRDMGKANFAVLQDATGKIQFYIKQDDIWPGEDKTLYQQVWKKLVDIGDIIGIKGYVFTTKTGETSVHVKEFTILTKSLKPLPSVKEKDGESFDEVTDPEFKYRQRYVDLTINPDVKETFVKRTKMINTIREFLNEKGALEVDTPVLQVIPGGAAARPFITHHNALDTPFYLRIANELYLKRLLVGGFDWVYEFSRNFRNEGMDRTHNPEFTILEWYTAYKDYFWMMEITEQLMERIAIALHGTTDVPLGDNIISYKAPFKRVTILDAIKENTGIDVSEKDEAGLREVCKQLNIGVPGNIGKGKLIDEIFG
ncbi:MAG TPA: amino acid--tRNA ligase-related protein, partial [Chitinophagaceae bacterium]|nr:amino acid--tRNA ligase-related protein [Chitinophagaceae bacterium]